MKELRVTFTDAEFRKLKAKKKPKESWHDYVIRLERGCRK